MNNKTNNKAFTLIELLSVIIILAVIVLIAIPVVSKIMTNVKLDALKDSTYGVVAAATMYYSINSEAETSKIFTLYDGKFKDGDEELKYKGTIKGTGNVVIDPSGDITICINSNGAYSYKSYNTEVVSSGLGDTCKVENNFFVNKYITYLSSEGSVIDDYYNKTETDSLMNNYVNLSSLNSVSDSTYEAIEYSSFSLVASGSKLLSNGTSEFGTISNGVLTFNQNGLYYVTSNLTATIPASAQIYNIISVNNIIMTQSFASSASTGIPATVFVYAKAGDTIKPYLMGYNATSSIYKWSVNIYKML